MTIASEVNRSGPYTCNGATTHFPFGFRIYDAAHIRVILTDPQGTESTLSLGTGYTVSGVGQSGGGAVDTAVAYAAGYRVTLILNVPFTQNIDLENQGAYFAETIERAIDQQTQMSLQLKEQVARAVVLPVTSSVSVDTLTSAVLSLSDIQPQMQALVPIAEDIKTVAGISGAVVAAGGYANTATTAATLATSKAAEAAASADAAALFDPASHYLKTEFKADGSPDAPVKSGVGGELTGHKLIVNGVAGQQERLEFQADGALKWLLFRDVDDTFRLQNNVNPGVVFSVDPTSGRLDFALTPTSGGRSLVLLDVSGKLPALDGSQLTGLASVPTGFIGYTAEQSPPPGWLERNGAAISRTAYANLFAKIGTTFGAGDGSSTFNLPDARGTFDRGWDHGRGLDGGRGFGSYQGDMFASHAHSFALFVNGGTQSKAQAGNSSYGSASTDAAGGNETRPKNVAYLPIIKY